MNPAQIAILFLIGYSILITIGFIIKSAKLRKHKALFNVEWIEYPPEPQHFNCKPTAPFKTLGEKMLEDVKARASKVRQLCKNKNCTVYFDKDLTSCPACLTKVE